MVGQRRNRVLVKLKTSSRYELKRLVKFIAKIVDGRKSRDCYMMISVQSDNSFLGFLHISNEESGIENDPILLWQCEDRQHALNMETLLVHQGFERTNASYGCT